jgi:ketosteroid isomerase-like protein
MKKTMVAVFLVLAISSIIFGQAKPPQAAPAGQNASQEVSALEKSWITASIKHEVAWFEKNIGETYIGTDENGVVQDKAALIADVKNQVSKTESISYENFKVTVYGDAAVATGISVSKGTYKGKDNSGKYPWTDTWIKKGGQWQCVASHSSKIVAK